MTLHPISRLRDHSKQCLSNLRPVGGVVYAIVGENTSDLEWIDSIKAGDIESVLGWVRSPLVMRVYPADFAEKMFRGFRIELIEAEKLGPLENFDSRQRHGGGDGASSTTKRAIAAPHVDETIGQIEFELNATAVTCRSVLWLNRYAINFFDIQRHLASLEKSSESKMKGMAPLAGARPFD